MDYSVCAFPKPGTTKKDKKENGFKDKPNRRCHYTGQPGAERHEVYPGKNRQTSIDHGFQIDVCPPIHEALQKNSTDWAIAENLRWRKHFQRQYEKKLVKNGVSKEDARKMWRFLIGKNYL